MRDTMLVSSAVFTGAPIAIGATSNKLAASALGEHHRMGDLVIGPRPVVEPIRNSRS